MSARHANRRKSNCCDSVGCCSTGVHPCQREIERCDFLRGDFLGPDSSGADFWGHFSGNGSFGVRRGRGLRFGFAIGRPNGIASRPIECRANTRVRTHETKRTGRVHAASVLAASTPSVVASGAPLLAPRVELLAEEAERLAAARATAVAADTSLRAEVATGHCPARRVRINFFDALYFRFGASGRLSAAMIDASQPLIGSNGMESTGGVDRASDCADVSARWDVSTSRSLLSRDDRRFNRSPLTPIHVERSGPSGSHPTERAA